MRRLVGGLLLLAALSALMAPPRLRARQALELNAMEMLDLYDRRRELALTGFQDRLQIDSIYDELTASGKKWIDADGPAAAPRRRLVLATFVLEVLQHMAPTREMSAAEAAAQGAAASPDPRGGGKSVAAGAPPTTAGASGNANSNLGVALRLANFVRQQLVNQRTPLPLEKTWHEALIGLIEYYGGKDSSTPGLIGELTVELEYVRDRYPKDKQFLLPRAWVDYYGYRPPGVSMLWPEKMGKDHIWDTWEIPFLTTAEAYYADALANPPTAAEARVRVGEMRVKRNDPDGALAILHEADQASSDKEIRYLSSLEQGWAYELKSDRPQAIASFRRALAFLPDAQTASIALAGLLVIDGQTAEASDTATRALTHDVLDPWIFHRYPAYEHFPELMDKLREELK